jgi:putative transcriptional regulator
MLNTVRQLRTDQGLSQSDLGAALRVSRQTINAIETGRYLPSLPLALKLAAFFSTAVEQMFLIDDEVGDDA